MNKFSFFNIEIQAEPEGVTTVSTGIPSIPVYQETYTGYTLVYIPVLNTIIYYYKRTLSLYVQCDAIKWKQFLRRSRLGQL